MPGVIAFMAATIARHCSFKLGVLDVLAILPGFNRGFEIEQLFPFAVAKLFAGLEFAGVFLQFGHQSTYLNHSLLAVFA